MFLHTLNDTPNITNSLTHKTQLKIHIYKYVNEGAY